MVHIFGLQVNCLPDRRNNHSYRNFVCAIEQKPPRTSTRSTRNRIEDIYQRDRHRTVAVTCNHCFEVFFSLSCVQLVQTFVVLWAMFHPLMSWNYAPGVYAPHAAAKLTHGNRQNVTN